MNVGRLARKMFGGGKGATLEAFAEAIGTSISALYRREHKHAKIEGAFAALCRLIVEMEKKGLSDMVVETALGVPKDERSEDRCLLALALRCFEEGHANLVREAMGEKVDGKEGDESLDMGAIHFMRLLENATDGLETRAKKIGGKAAARYQRAASSLAAALYEIRMAKAAEDEEKQQQEESG